MDMSTSSARRIKDRGRGNVTAVVAAKPSKTLTPVSEKVTGAETFKKSTGKENPRPTSRGRASLQKPQAIRPMSRIDGGEGRVRWSTSSASRGRSSSPFELDRVLSDMRKIRGSRVSEDQCEKREIERSLSSGGRSVIGVRVSEQKKGTLRDLNARSTEVSENNSRVLKQKKIAVNPEVDSEKSGEIFKKYELNCRESGKSRVGVLEECKGGVNLSLILSKSCLDTCDSESNLDSNVKVLGDLRICEESKGRSCVDLQQVVGEKSMNCVELGVKELGGKTMIGSRGSESLNQKGLVKEGIGGRSINKYPSKLHEKLAFLEGKVKRIASDIKRTKEMLDLNNPDTSKVILSDIQEKISGIEKAMGNVADGKMGEHKSTENGEIQGKCLEKVQNKEVDHAKGSVKGLNSEELEARLFPHHKLLRDRTSLKVSSGSSQYNQTGLVESSCELKPDEKVIALEFLASLNNNQSKVTMRGEQVGSELSEAQETDGAVTSAAQDSLSMVDGKGDLDLILTTSETLDEFDDQENRPAMIIEEETKDSCIYELNEIGRKISTGGWFVSEGEAVLLAHDDGSCSFYDIANCEEKAEYKPPVGVSPNIWRDCWIIRAPGADGCSGRYVVAASAGNTLDSGFCSWDFYTKDVRAFHIEDGATNSRTALAPLPNNSAHRRNTLSTIMAPENRQWWYKPCGPLMISTASCQRAVRLFDIRDGEQVMKWEVLKPVLAMDYSSPLQWRNRGKVVVAEAEAISLWDVSSLNPQALLSVSSSGRKVYALHVNNTDAELGGGVRHRSSSSEAEGNDGVFCTADSINILDFREPSGVGLKIPKLGVTAQSVFSRGDSIFLGCTNARSGGGKQPCSQVQQFSLRKQRLFSTYSLPESNAHSHYTAITQVWGNSNFVMGVCGLGLFVFDALKDDGLQSFPIDYSNMQKVREVIGPDDLYSPSFDYLASRVLLISRDRPAQWRYLL
ncbi:KIN14B-interacting protein At4g14310-like [Actinidia eriantha]|uniref:KIN14B-interacting protein At4g14310-like n=1 Tax=Actinidia eriantha TaxID=165200 RepID=UPI00258617BE|nr:KIN14B-interacting protein At4g14310-like [Actinidia eriantha]